MYIFKKVGVESANALTNLQAEAFQQAYRNLHSPENLRAYCAQNYSTEQATAVLSHGQCDCVVAYHENLPRGYYLLNHQSCPIELDGTSSELKQIYILSSEYGRGLGNMLLKHACDLTRRANHRWVWLCVSDNNHRAQRFYQKLNFKPVAPGPILRVGTDRLPSTILVLGLDSAG